MIYKGPLNQDVDLQIKALGEVSNFLIVLRKRNLKELYKIAQKSWKKKGLWKRKHKVSDIVFPPKFDMYEIIKIELHSLVMIDATIKFTSYNSTELRTIRFYAEKPRNKTHKCAKFRFDPNSIEN